MTVLYGTRVALRPIEASDVAHLARILNQDEVARWWPHYDQTRVCRELLHNADVTAYTVLSTEDGDRIIGCVQFHEEPAPDYRHATIDVFLDADVHGKGLGTEAVRTIVRHLFHDRGHHRLAIDPAADNERAVRAYERVGFRRIGVARGYERTADGEWQDALLMDLLKTDTE